MGSGWHQADLAHRDTQIRLVDTPQPVRGVFVVCVYASASASFTK